MGLEIAYMLQQKGLQHFKRSIAISIVCPFYVQCSRIARKNVNFDSRLRSLSTTTTERTSKFDFNPTGPCSVLEWASMPANRSVASECLNVPSSPPPPTFFHPNASHGILNWEDYWTNREWKFPNSLKDDTEREYGQALASHVMTAPMTIYSMLDQLLEARTKVATSSKTLTKEELTTRKVRWCCIGARSEASLPIQYWQEMIDMIHASRLFAFRNDTIETRNNMNIGNQIFPNLLDITLDFIGPEMNIQPSIVLHPSKSLQHDEYNFVDNGTRTSIFTTCTVQWRYKGLYHTHYNEINEHEDQCDKQYDAYILFNPGIGHPYLQKLWQPTLQILFEQYDRISSTVDGGCSIMLTSHSMTDALRDSNLLQNYLMFANDYNKDKYITPTIATTDDSYVPESQVEETVNFYTENPFASQIYYHDPMVRENSNQSHIVRPNHYVAILRRQGEE